MIRPFRLAHQPSWSAVGLGLTCTWRMAAGAPQASHCAPNQHGSTSTGTQPPIRMWHSALLVVCSRCGATVMHISWLHLSHAWDIDSFGVLLEPWACMACDCVIALWTSYWMWCTAKVHTEQIDLPLPGQGRSTEQKQPKDSMQSKFIGRLWNGCDGVRFSDCSSFQEVCPIDSFNV